jgi:hypothetical protein
LLIFFVGGNSVESAAPGPVKHFVAQNGGHTVITSILIANNGIAAVKEIRSIRKWYFPKVPRNSALHHFHEKSAKNVLLGRMKHSEMRELFHSSLWLRQTI